jgi:hypothetical protein
MDFPTQNNTAVLVDVYRRNPQLFTNDQVDELENNAKEEGLEFTRDPGNAGFDIARTVFKLGQGFFTGFTTIDVGDKPRNTVESTSENIGHLLGFVGYIPGLGSVAKVGTMGAATAARYIARGLEGAELAGGALRMLKAEQAIVRGGSIIKSVPMLAGDAALAGVERFAKQSAMLQASKFFREGALGRDLFQGAFQMGVASAVSAAPIWQPQVDERMKAFWGGAQFGLFQRLLGNVVTQGGLVDAAKIFGDGSPEAARQGNAIIRSVSGALFLGLPSTLAHDPLEIQVYNYLLNGYFGYKEMSRHERAAWDFLKPYASEERAEYRLYDVEQLPGFENLSKPAQDEARYQGDLLWARKMDTQIAMADAFMGALKDQNYSPEQVKEKLAAQHIKLALSEEKETLKKAGFSEEEAQAKAEESVRKTVAHEATVLQDQLREARKNALTASELSKDLEASLQNMELQSYAEEKGVQLGIASALTDAAKAEHTRLGEKSPGVLELHKKMIGLVAEGGRADTFTAFEKRFLKAFPESGDRVLGERKLRLLYNIGRNGREVQKLQFDADSELLQVMPNVDTRGKDTKEVKILSFLDEQTGMRVWELSTVVAKDEFGRPTVREIQSEDVKVNLAKIISQALDKNMVVVGGVKDSSKLLLVDTLVRPSPEQPGVYERLVGGGTFNLDEKLKAMGDAMQTLPEVYGKFNMSAGEFFQTNLERFAQAATGDAASGELVHAYRMATANNIALWEHLNGGILAEEMIKEPKRFLNSATKLNKRLQLLYSGDTPLDHELARTVRGAEDGLFKGMLVRTDTSDTSIVTRQSNFDKERQEFYDQVIEADFDGVMAVRGDMFDALARSVGTTKPTGAQKGTIVFTDPTHGLFLGKLAFHRAGPEMEKHLTALDLHYQIYDSAAKQFGKRPVHTETWAKGGIVYTQGDWTFAKPEAGDILNIPAEAIRVNPTTMETGELHDVHIVKQLLEHLDSEGARVAEQTLMVRSWEGVPEANRDVEELQSHYAAEKPNQARIKELEEKLDVENINLQQLVDIVAGNRLLDTPLYRRVLEHILNRPLPDAESIGVEERAGLERLLRAKSAADTILANAEWTPIVMAKQQVKDYLNMRLVFYLRDRMTKPISRGSHKGVMYNYDLFQQAKFKLKPGEYMAADGLKDLMVPLDEGAHELRKLFPGSGGRVSLGDLWEKYDREKGHLSSAERKQLEDHLKHVLVRVPADSPSGVRVLRFRGFTGGQGTGFIIHAEDMANMGGADKDIDAAFLYAGLPRAMRDSFDRPEVRDQWYEFHLDKRTLEKGEPSVKVHGWLDAKTFYASIPKKDRRYYAKRMIDSKERHAFLDKTRSQDDLLRAAHPLGMFDPLTMTEVNRDVVRGNQLLGPMLANAKRWRAVRESAGMLPLEGKISKKASKWYAKTKGWKLPAGIQWELTPLDSDGRELDVLAREGVNGAADAADGHRVVSRGQALKMIAEGAYSARFFNRKGKEIDPVGTDLEKFIPKPKDFKALQDIDRVMSGIDERTGRAFSLDEWIERLKDTRDFSQTQTRPWYRAAYWLSHLDVGTETYPFVGENNAQEAIRLLAEIYNGHDALAQTVQDVSFRKHIGFASDPYKYRESTYYKYRTFVDEEGKKHLIKRTPREQREIDRDFMVNDLEDVASQILKWDAAKAVFVDAEKKLGRELTEEEVDGLKTKMLDTMKAVDELRLEHTRIKKRADTQKDARVKVVSMSEVTREATKKAAAFWKSLDAPMRFLAEVHALSTLRIQERESRDVVKSVNAQLASLEAKKHQAVSGEDVDAYEKKIAELQEAKAKIVKRWYETGGSAYPYVQDYISGSTIAAHLAKFSDIARITWKESLSEAELREIANMKRMDKSASEVVNVLPQAEEMNVAPKVEEFVAKFTSQIEELTGRPMKSSPKTQVRLRRYSEELRSLLNNTPSLLKNFELLFQGTLLKNRALEVGTAPSIATMRDLEDFLEAFKYRGRWWYELAADPRKLALVRKHFFLFPESIAKEHLPFDPNRVTLREQPVWTEDGVQRRPVSFFISHMGTLSQFFNHMGMQYDGMSRRIEDDSAKRDRQVAQLNASGDGLGTQLYEIAVAMHEYGNYAKNPEVMKLYDDNYEKARKDLAKIGPEREFIVRDELGKEYKITAQDAVREMRNSIREWNKHSRRLVYNPEAEAALIKTRTTEDGLYTEVDIQKTLDTFNKWVLEGREIPNIGLNGLYRILHQIALEKVMVDQDTMTVPLGSLRLEDRAREIGKIRETPGKEDWMEYEGLEKLLQSGETYFPHSGHPKRAVEAYLGEKLKELTKKDTVPGSKERAQLEMQIRYGLKLLDDFGVTHEADAILGEATLGRASEMTVPSIIPSHLKGRDEDAFGPMPEWDRTPQALVTYEKQMSKAYANLLSSILASRTIEDFERRKVMGEHTRSWTRFMQMYTRQAVGLPSIFPSEWLADKEFHRSLNPYFALTDDKYVKLYRSVTKKYDLMAKEMADQYRATKGALPKKEEEKIDAEIDKLVARKIATLSNLEAKWEMLTLLTHTKTMVNNLMGGTINTVVSAGLNPWRTAGNISRLRELLGEWVTGKDAIQQFVEKYGGVESYIRNELQFGDRFQVKHLADALNEAMAEIKRNPKLQDTQLWEIAKKYGIQKTVMEKAAWFMRVTERTLRSRSWMAHYLQARSALGANGLTFEPNDPWLVRMANKGVSASQFLYSNANRPAFAATTMGKVFARFQLYMYNSVHFRSEIAREAARLNFRQGTVEAERFKRMVVADMFIMALASVFPAGIFKQAVAAPWQYLVDMSSFVFGDEKERDQAFGGMMPYPANLLQPITPPVARYIEPVLANTITGDWNRFAEYTAWTYFPYGRLVNDARITLEKPSRLIENSIGLPYNRLAQEIQRGKKEQHKARIRSILSGIF